MIRRVPPDFLDRSPKPTQGGWLSFFFRCRHRKKNLAFICNGAGAASWFQCQKCFMFVRKEFKMDETIVEPPLQGILYGLPWQHSGNGDKEY
jgi:hypothetical protein